MPTDKSAKLAEKVAEEGRFSAMEDDDNAIDTSNDKYIGVDAEYQNAADYGDKRVSDSPQEDPDDEVAQRVKASAEELSNLSVNAAGHTPNEHRAGLGVKVGDEPAAAEEPTEEPQSGSDEGNQGTQPGA